jgi:hypothetical protein
LRRHVGSCKAVQDLKLVRTGPVQKMLAPLKAPPGYCDAIRRQMARCIYAAGLPFTTIENPEWAKLGHLALPGMI